MTATLQFDPVTHQLTGPAGSLAIAECDEIARRFLMLQEGECLDTHIADVSKKYGYCRQRYYQILDAFLKGGLLALQPRKTGPKSNYRRTDQVVRQILRYRFLHPDASAEVIAQKLRQTDLSISRRSVERVIAEYGLSKKTPLVEPQNPAFVATQTMPRQTPAP